MSCSFYEFIPSLSRTHTHNHSYTHSQVADYDRAHHELCRVFESKLTALQSEFTQQQSKTAAASHEQVDKLTQECDQVCVARQSLIYQI